MPRHGRLTQDLIDQLAQRIRAGNNLSSSCQSQGVNTGLVRRWRERGEAEIARLEEHPDSSPLTTEYLYRALSAEIDKALADAEAGRVIRILEAGRPHEVVKVVETTRNIRLRLYDDQNRPYDEVRQFTDVRRETTTEWDWRAAAWWLERARPQFWGSKQPAGQDTNIVDERTPELDADITERTNTLLDELRQRREAHAQAAAASGE